MKPFIALIGSGSDVLKVGLEQAEEIGRAVAEKDGVLVTGGRGGVMEAASRGAKENGGLVVGILPGYSRAEANDFVDIAIPTGLGFALRNFITIRSADAVIMIQGEIGTLSEVVLSYQHGKPLVVLETTGGWAGRLREVALEDGAYLDTRRLMTIHYAKSGVEAVDLAFSLIGTVPPPHKI